MLDKQVKSRVVMHAYCKITVPAVRKYSKPLKRRDLPWVEQVRVDGDEQITGVAVVDIQVANRDRLGIQALQTRDRRIHTEVDARQRDEPYSSLGVGIGNPRKIQSLCSAHSRCSDKIVERVMLIAEYSKGHVTKC